MQQLIKLSKTSKLNCFSFGVDAHDCLTGQKLRKIKNSTCSKCYALRGNYNYPDVRKGKRNNLNHFNAPYFVYVMSFQLQSQRYFRWFDSGDLPSFKILLKIIKIAKNTPHCQHWLATREIGFKNKLDEFIKLKKISLPKNIIIRVSSPLIDDKPLKSHKHTTTVFKDRKKAVGFICKAKDQGGKCLNCVACWDKKIKNIAYELH